MKHIIYLVYWVLRTYEPADVTVNGIKYSHDHVVFTCHDSAFTNLCEAEQYWQTLKFNQPGYEYVWGARISEAKIVKIEKADNLEITGLIKTYIDKGPKVIYLKR